jgi:hypothetical protein
MTTYLGSGDVSKRERGHRPEWIDRLADDVTMEASVLNGIVVGAEKVRAIIGVAATLYEYQEFEYEGRPYGEPGHGSADDYSARVHGEPIAGTEYAQYFLTPEQAAEVAEATKQGSEVTR